MNPTHGADRHYDKGLAEDDARHCWIENRAREISLDWQTEHAISGRIDDPDLDTDDLRVLARGRSIDEAIDDVAWEWAVDEFDKITQ